MSYIEENLSNGEKVVFQTRKHWMVFAWSVFWFLFGIIYVSNSADAAKIFGGMCLLLAICLGVLNLIELQTSEFGITNKRVIIKTGVFSRDTLEMQLSKIESVQVKQGIFGRMFNYGTLIIKGTGGTPGLYKKICDPINFKKHSMNPENAPKAENINASNSDVTQCPYCAEDIKKAAKVCKHCGKDLKS